MTKTVLNTLTVDSFDSKEGLVYFVDYEASDPTADYVAVESASVDDFLVRASEANEVAFRAEFDVLCLMAKPELISIVRSGSIFSPHFNSVFDAQQHRDSLGGFRQITALDLIMLRGFHAAMESDEDTAVGLLRGLPLYRYLSFIVPRSDLRLAETVFFLFDPRLHIDPERPDSSSAFRRAIGASGPKDVKLRRAMMGGWCVSGSHDLSVPGTFLIRKLHKEDKLRRPDPFLRPHQKFSAFLRYAWLETLRPGQCRDPLFVPELVFGDDQLAVQVFKAHMASALDDGGSSN